jgi:DNA-binding transcriptional MerR regulator
MPDLIQKFLTVGDVAHQLRCSPRRVIQLADLGTLPIAARTDHGWRLFDPADVDRLQRERDARATSRRNQAQITLDEAVNKQSIAGDAERQERKTA